MKLLYWVIVAALLAIVAASFGSGVYLVAALPTADMSYKDILALREDTTLGIYREIHAWLAIKLLVAMCAYLVISIAVLFSERFSMARALGLVALVAAGVLLGADRYAGRYESGFHGAILPVGLSVLLLTSIWMLRPTKCLKRELNQSELTNR